MSIISDDFQHKKDRLVGIKKIAWLAPLQGDRRMGLHTAGQSASCKCSTATRWPTSSLTSTRPSPSTSSSWPSSNCTFFSKSDHSPCMFSVSSFCHIFVLFLTTTLCFSSNAVSLCQFLFLVNWFTHLLTSWSLMVCNALHIWWSL